MINLKLTWIDLSWKIVFPIGKMIAGWSFQQRETISSWTQHLVTMNQAHPSIDLNYLRRYIILVIVILLYMYIFIIFKLMRYIIITWAT